MFSERTILTLQSIATILMAADYFFTELQRERINTFIQNAINPMDTRVTEDIRQHIQQASESAFSIAVALLLLLLSWIGLKLLPLAPAAIYNFWILVALSLIVLGLLAAAGPKLVEFIVGRVVPLATAATMSLLFKFLIRCPKGTVFGLGFLFLAASFVCRWSNL